MTPTAIRRSRADGCRPIICKGLVRVWRDRLDEDLKAMFLRVRVSAGDLLRALGLGSGKGPVDRPGERRART